MPLRHRPPVLDTTPATLLPGLEHLDQRWVTLVRWLGTLRLDFVLIGAAAHAARGERGATGPLVVVPAPYLRNLQRLAGGLAEIGVAGSPATTDFTRGERISLRVAGAQLDVEPAPGGRYQELLYEATRIALAEGIAVQVAGWEDLEHFAQLTRTGQTPEFRVSRGVETTDADAAVAGESSVSS